MRSASAASVVTSSLTARTVWPGVDRPSGAGGDERDGRRVTASSSLDLAAGVGPFADAAGHGRDIVVSHVLHRLRGQHGPIPARTVDDDLGCARNPLFDGRLDDAAREERGFGQVTEVPLVLLADIEVDGGLAARLHLEHLGDRDLLDPLPGLADQLGSTFVGHWRPATG